MGNILGRERKPQVVPFSNIVPAQNEIIRQTKQSQQLKKSEKGKTEKVTPLKFQK